MSDSDWAQAQDDIGDEIATRSDDVEPETEECLTCGGSGYTPPPRTQFCADCDGTGLVPVEMFV